MNSSIQKGIMLALLTFAILGCDSEEFKLVPDLSLGALFVNDLEGEYVNINDIRMYYEIHGHGEPLLLLHGGFGFIESFYKQIPAFSKDFQVIAPDLRGHGRTSDSNQALTYDLMASDVVELLDLLDVKSTSVVGWSDGAKVGLYLAIQYPDLVSKLVLIGSNFSPDGLADNIIEYAKSSETSELDREALKWYRKLSPNPEHWMMFQKKVKTMWLTLPDLTAKELSTILVPTLIIAGENGLVRLEHTKKLYDAIPNAELHVVRGASHLLPLERPKIVNKLVISFLKSPAS